MDDNKEMKDLGERMVSSKEVFSGKLLHVYSDRVVLPNGRETGRECVCVWERQRGGPLALFS